MVKYEHFDITNVILSGTRKSLIMVKCEHGDITNVILSGTRKSLIMVKYEHGDIYKRDTEWDTEVSDYGEM